MRLHGLRLDILRGKCIDPGGRGVIDARLLVAADVGGGVVRRGDIHEGGGDVLGGRQHLRLNFLGGRPNERSFDFVGVSYGLRDILGGGVVGRLGGLYVNWRLVVEFLDHFGDLDSGEEVVGVAVVEVLERGLREVLDRDHLFLLILDGLIVPELADGQQELGRDHFVVAQGFGELPLVHLALVVLLEQDALEVVVGEQAVEGVLVELVCFESAEEVLQLGLEHEVLAADGLQLGQHLVEVGLHIVLDEAGFFKVDRRRASQAEDLHLGEELVDVDVDQVVEIFLDAREGGVLAPWRSVVSLFWSLLRLHVLVFDDD